MTCPRCKGTKKIVYLKMGDEAIRKIHVLGEVLPNEPVPTCEMDCPECFGTGMV
jgi:hypothetical protein